MNTLQDLRATLDQHAHQVGDDASVSRVAAVRGRARRARRQRAGGVVAAAALVVAGVVTAPMLTDTPPPRGERWLAGHEAPATMESLGYTYGFAEGVENDGSRRASVRLPVSGAPRLVTWASDASEVTVDTPYDRISSGRTGFDDFVVVRPEESGRWAVSARGADVALAVYELDELPPGTRVDDDTVFRDRVGSDQLLDVAVGKPGQMDVSLPLTLPEGRLRVVEFCQAGARDGASWVNTSVDGEGAMASEGCYDPGYDPGADGQSTWYEPGQLGEPGETVTFRTWFSERFRGPAAGSVPGARLGLAVYRLAEPAAVVAGWDVPQLYEYEGHLWSFVASRNFEPGSGFARWRNPGSDPVLTVASFSRVGPATVAFRASGRSGGDQVSETGSGADLVALLEPEEQAVLDVRGEPRGASRLGYATYERVD